MGSSPITSPDNDRQGRRRHKTTTEGQEYRMKEKGNPILRYFNRACLILILILISILTASYFTGKADLGKTVLHKYIFTAEDFKQNKFSFLCYEGYYDFVYDFILNMKDKNYKSIFLHSDRGINTQNTIACIKYSLENKSLDNKASEASQKSKTGKVIAIVGNSFTYGEGVPVNRSYPEVMNRLIKKTKSPEWNVINFGIVQGGIENISSVAFSKAVDSGPVRIIYTFMADDVPSISIMHSEIKRPYDNVNRINPYDYFTGPPWLRHFRVMYFDFYSEEIYENWVKGLYGPENFDGMAEFKGILAEMNSACKKRGVEFTVAIFPLLIGNRQDYPFEEINAYVRETLKDMHIGYCDLTAAALSVPSGKRWVHPIDHHPSVAVHEKAAAALNTCIGRFAQD